MNCVQNELIILFDFADLCYLVIRLMFCETAEIKMIHRIFRLLYAHLDVKKEKKTLQQPGCFKCKVSLYLKGKQNLFIIPYSISKS